MKIDKAMEMMGMYRVPDDCEVNQFGEVIGITTAWHEVEPEIAAEVRAEKSDQQLRNSYERFLIDMLQSYYPTHVIVHKFGELNHVVDFSDGVRRWSQDLFRETAIPRMLAARRLWIELGYLAKETLYEKI